MFNTLKHIVVVVGIMVFFLPKAQSQDSPSFTANGYVKSLQTFLNPNDLDNLFYESMIHHRLNTRFQITSGLALKTDVRTRILTGDLVRLFPGYTENLDLAANDQWDLSVAPIDRNSIFMHSYLDRFYLEYSKDKWEVRLGRQRINWGISTIWNPNDIFNAFAFTDFDYEERPGADALRIRYFTGFVSSVELSVRYFEDWDEAIIAGIWRFNKWNYDFQILAGKHLQDAVLGMGWAGNLGNSSLKGEVSYFAATIEDRRDNLSLTAGWDYSFDNDLYLNVGYLFNENGTGNVDAANLLDFELSARNLYPYKHSVLVQGLYPASPLINTALIVVYSPGERHALFLNPVMTWSMATNWDFDLVGQLVFEDNGDKYNSPLQAIFLRFKYSY